MGQAYADAADRAPRGSRARTARADPALRPLADHQGRSLRSRKQALALWPRGPVPRTRDREREERQLIHRHPEPPWNQDRRVRDGRELAALRDPPGPRTRCTRRAYSLPRDLAPRAGAGGIAAALGLVQVGKD